MKKQFTYYCDQCGKLINKGKPGSGEDYIQETVKFDEQFLKDFCSFQEEREIAKPKDLCRNCFNKETEEYSKLVKKRTKAIRRRQKIARLLSFNLPIISLNLRWGEIKIQSNYVKCKHFWCWRNGKKHHVEKDKKNLYFCEKHRAILVDSLIAGKIEIPEFNEQKVKALADLNELQEKIDEIKTSLA